MSKFEPDFIIIGAGSARCVLLCAPWRFARMTAAIRGRSTTSQFATPSLEEVK